MTTAELQQARAALQALQAPDKPPSKAERFRQLLPDIETSIRNSITHADIITALAQAGLQMTESEFRNALCRERKRLRKKATPHEASQTPATPPAITQAAKPQQQQRGDFRQQRDKPINW